MEHGKYEIESGSADEVILHPKEAYTQRLINDVPKIHEESKGSLNSDIPLVLDSCNIKNTTSFQVNIIIFY